jgi:RhtB (resistance to homoserine/threonine) family protein
MEPADPTMDRMSVAHLLAFAGIVLVAAMAPGPDFAIVVRQSVASGTRSGMAAALGVGAGVFVWAVSAAIGVAALLAASAAAFTIVKVVGAAYLLYLGVRALRAASRRADASEPSTGSGRPRRESVWTSFRQGIITNVFNPKAAAFFVALMPQFVGSGSAYGATLLLAGIAGATAIAWFCVLANLVGALRRVFARPTVRRAIDAITGTALVGLGIRLAVASRP